MGKALVRGMAVHPSVQARHPAVIFTSTTFSHFHPPIESFREYFPLHQSLCPCPGSVSHWLSPGLHPVFPFLQAPLSPQFIIPTGPHLFLHRFPVVNNFNYFVIMLSPLFLDFPVKPGSQWPNKNSLAQSSPLQECILWYGGDKAHNGLAIQLDMVWIQELPLAYRCSVWVSRIVGVQEQGDKSDKESKTHVTGANPLHHQLQHPGSWALLEKTIQMCKWRVSTLSRSQKCSHLPLILVSTVSHVPPCHS